MRHSKLTAAMLSVSTVALFFSSEAKANCEAYMSTNTHEDRVPISAESEVYLWYDRNESPIVSVTGRYNSASEAIARYENLLSDVCTSGLYRNQPTGCTAIGVTVSQFHTTAEGEEIFDSTRTYNLRDCNAAPPTPSIPNSAPFTPPPSGSDPVELPAPVPNSAPFTPPPSGSDPIGLPENICQLRCYTPRKPPSLNIQIIYYDAEGTPLNGLGELRGPYNPPTWQDCLNIADDLCYVTNHEGIPCDRFNVQGGGVFGDAPQNLFYGMHGTRSCD